MSVLTVSEPAVFPREHLSPFLASKSYDSLHWLPGKGGRNKKINRKVKKKKKFRKSVQLSAIFTLDSTVFCHRRSLSATASGRECVLLLVTLGSFITEPKEPFTRWIRDLRRHERACRDTAKMLSQLLQTLKVLKWICGVHDTVIFLYTAMIVAVFVIILLMVCS